VPEGPAQTGQRITAHAQALRRRWPIRIQVEAVDTSRRQLAHTTDLPLGITILNQIAVNGIDDRRSLVSFG